MKVPLRLRTFGVWLFDIFAVALMWFVAYGLRFNFDMPPAQFVNAACWSLVAVVFVYAGFFWRFGLYKGIWVFASLPDLWRMSRAIGGAALTVLFVVLFARIFGVPRSVLVIHPVLVLVTMGGARFAWRAWKEHQRWGALAACGKPVLIIGAGGAGVQLARELMRSAEWRVLGFLDDDPHKLGRELLGLRIVGRVEELPTLTAKFKLRHVMIAMPTAGIAAHKRVMALCVEAGVRAQMLPSLEGMMRPGDAPLALREVDVEDLLGRDSVSIDSQHVGAMLAGKTVLVTGAGGSIGSELCRQIARFKPAALVAYELNEFALYQLTEEFATRFPDVNLLAITGDVRDAAWLANCFQRFAPKVVFHAAAYKHVPLMEEHNAWQAMRNNVFGTWSVCQAVLAAGVERMVLVSTDKAVNPTNVMGASKRLAEMMCLAAQRQTTTTRFECVRFGNVLGSVGSVVPKFRAQIAQGGPVTVTHPEMTRYFMSIPEAAQLVLQAGSMGEGGEIFVLDMGEPVKIMDLARDMIRLSGASENDIRIEITGLRPGEKLYEELLADNEATRETHHPKLRVAKAREVDLEVVDEVLQCLRALDVKTSVEVKRCLRKWVPEYQSQAAKPVLQRVPTMEKRVG